MKFIITGGHHNSALVLAKELINQGHTVVWIGHKHAQLRDKNYSAEYIEVISNNIPFHNLSAGKTTINTWHKIPLGIIQALDILREQKPDAVLSFGSYLGATVSIASAILRIPIFIHEQTVVLGKANAISSKLARKIFLTWQQSLKYFPKHKSMVVGLPLRNSIKQLSQKHSHRTTSYIKSKSNNGRGSTTDRYEPSKPYTILIMGGKQGSHFINELIFSTLSLLTSRYNIIHQTGTSTVTNDYNRAQEFAKHIPNYKPYGYIDENNIGRYLSMADVVVSRSGAHTTYELAFLKKPSILIPFEYTHRSEQLLNARILENTGQAIILRQNSATPKALLDAITKVISISPSDIKDINLPSDAEKVMVREILKDLTSQK